MKHQTNTRIFLNNILYFAVYLLFIPFFSMSVDALSGSSDNETIAQAICSTADQTPDTYSACLSQANDELIEACGQVGPEGIESCKRSFLYRSMGWATDWNRTVSECNRLDNPWEQRACIAWASENPGGVSQDSGSQAGNLDGNCQGSLDPENCGITELIRQITDALLVLVGIVVVMMIIVGGIQYSAAGSNPQAVAAAKKKISQALFALVIFLFMGAFLQWLIPGGIF